MSFQFTGFTDEAEKSLDQQIAVLKEVGWSAIELRLINGKNVCDQTDDEWRETLEALQVADISIVGFGGQIGNWARPIQSDFQNDLDELKRVAPRMRSANCKYLRIMSYPNVGDSPFSRSEWKKEAVNRIRELSELAEGEGIILGHENCTGYGESAQGFLELVEAVNNPAFRLIFDSGNNTLHGNNNQVTWDYYQACRDQISHVHIKAGKASPYGSDFVACHVDEDPVQEKIIRDLEETGYDGYLSIEPHIMAAVHAGQDIDDSGEARRVWVDYAQRLETMVNSVTAS